MKRTRRIEVVRYTRRVTRGGGEVGADSGGEFEEEALALLLEAATAAEAAPEVGCDCAHPRIGPAPRSSARSLIRRLLDRLRAD